MRLHFMATPVVCAGRLYIGMGDDPEHEEGPGHFLCIDLAKAVDKGRVNKHSDVSPVNDNFDPKLPVNLSSALAWHYGEPAGPKQKMPGRRFLFGPMLSTAA